MTLVQNPNSNFTAFQTAFAGGAAGAITRAIAQPLDVLKVRFQIQLEPIKRGSKYSSILQAIINIVKEEGFFTLWSGHVPAQFLSISYGILQFTAFERLTVLCQQADSHFFITHKHGINFANGAIAASFATIVSFPFDTLRTRLIAEEKTHKAYRGFFDAFSTMVKNESPRALYKGLMPSLGQIAPHAGIQFAVYKYLTENILNKLPLFQRDMYMNNAINSTLIANLIAGSVAGFVSKTAIYPFDLVKKRLQIQGFQEHRKAFGKQMYCNNMFHCIKLTITEEGYLALYKGYGPSMLKAILVSALHFAVYDEIKHLIIKMQP